MAAAFIWWTIDGDIEVGDDKTFDAQVADMTQAVVRLSSRGGKAIPAMLIGETIHNKGFRTAVPDNTVCASSCGLIWLAGNPRMLTATSFVGFHAVGEEGQVSGSGNALVGVYLQELGINVK